MPPGRIRRALRRIVEDASAELRNDDRVTRAERTAPPAPERVVPVQQIRERPANQQRYTNSVTGTVFPMTSMSIDVGRLYPTYANSFVPLPRDMATSVPLRTPRQPIVIDVDAQGQQRVRRSDEATASSTPTATPSTTAPTLPLAWDDPTIKRVRRVVLED